MCCLHVGGEAEELLGALGPEADDDVGAALRLGLVQRRHARQLRQRGVKTIKVAVGVVIVVITAAVCRSRLPAAPARRERNKIVAAIYGRRRFH